MINETHAYGFFFIFIFLLFLPILLFSVLPLLYSFFYRNILTISILSFLIHTKHSQIRQSPVSQPNKNRASPITMKLNPLAALLLYKETWHVLNRCHFLQLLSFRRQKWLTSLDSGLTLILESIHHSIRSQAWVFFFLSNPILQRITWDAVCESTSLCA